MAVLVRIIGENDGSAEYDAAERLRGIITASIPRTVMGEIVLFPSATLYGQTVKDVDIIMIGNLRNYSARVTFNYDGDAIEAEVFLDTFCTTIEVKSHTISAVRKEGTNIQVYYSNSGWHNATKQSNDQKVSAMNFFGRALGCSPFITNLLWFVEVTPKELDNLLTFNNALMPSNTLPSSFDFSEVIEKLALQRTPWRHEKRFTIECGFNGRDVDGITKPLMFFSKVKSGMGELTRRKIESITNAELGEKSLDFSGNVLNIFRGRAGTGKTIDLIKLAIRLVDVENARVQILTYNRALVSDIRRLFAFAELPDMFEDRCVAVNTMQSFFFGLINGCLYDGKLSGSDFISRYKELLNEMLEFLRTDIESLEIIKSICEDNPKLNWNYILIDEAQDWSSEERDLILLLYRSNRIVVADGGQQFVRGIQPCDWTVVPERNNIKLKWCLRQKRNLVRFNNRVAEMMHTTNGKISPSEKLVGGKIIILRDKEMFYRTVKAEMYEMKKAGNSAYDFLFLVASTLVDEVEGRRSFSLLGEFERNNILLWDGTYEDNRLEYSVDLEEARVLQYESSRGLEGWTVCCMEYDEYMKIKEQQYEPEIDEIALYLESPEEKKNKYLLNWALLPLTRAIDTLIITLKDAESYYSKLLLELACENPDCISVV